jgi:hypothetical protein
MPRIGKAIRDIGFPVAVIAKPYEPTRSLEQNDKLHAMLTDISKQKQWAGQWLTVEKWKRLMMAAWCRSNNESAEILPAIDGHGFDVLYRRTSELSVKEMIEVIEFVQWWAVENDVRLAA